MFSLKKFDIASGIWNILYYRITTVVLYIVLFGVLCSIGIAYAFIYTTPVIYEEESAVALPQVSIAKEKIQRVLLYANEKNKVVLPTIREAVFFRPPVAP